MTTTTGTRYRIEPVPAEALAELFADPTVDRLHSRNVVYGCYMFAVVRG